MMKCTKTLASLTLILVGVLCANQGVAQDLTAFEVVDNESIGLTVTPYSKFGMAVGDFDKDGYADIFTIRWNGAGRHSNLYHNQNGQFQDISNQTPLQQIEAEGPTTETRTTVFVDFDNDGDQDISFGTAKELVLLRNDGGTFVNVAEEMGFVGQKPPGPFVSSWEYSLGGWADYDMDGDLDCVVGQINKEDGLYVFRNDGDHFTDVAAEVGLNLPELSGTSRLTWVDIDLDGDPDLYSQYDFFRNDNGMFTNITEELGLAGLENVSYREFLDYDNDGDFDFFKVVSAANDPATNEMWENRDGVFVNVTDDVGLTLSRDRYRSMTVGDFDNDGDLDIFVQLNIDPSLDVLLINDELEPGVRAFSDVAEFVGITKTGDRKGSAFLDYDHDGFLDIYLPSAEFNHILYHNLAGNGANWVVFMLEGTESNRDAVGSLVKLYAGGKMQMRYTKAGNGFVRQDKPHVHFGLGFETSIDSVVIRWPLGQKQVVTDVAINQYHKITEPGGAEVETKHDGLIPQSFRLEQNFPNPFNPKTKVTYSLSVDSDVRLLVYDITGKEVTMLVDDRQAAGLHSVTWDGRDARGVLQPSGIYMVRIQADDFVESKKMVFVQ